MATEAWLAIIGAVMGPVSGMFALYMRDMRRRVVARSHSDALLHELLERVAVLETTVARVESCLGIAPVAMPSPRPRLRSAP